MSPHKHTCLNIKAYKYIVSEGNSLKPYFYSFSHIISACEIDNIKHSLIKKKKSHDKIRKKCVLENSSNYSKKNCHGHVAEASKLYKIYIVKCTILISLCDCLVHIFEQAFRLPE